MTPAQQHKDVLSRLGNLLLLTCALRNAHCHTKNISLLYSGRQDIRLAPVYDMLTITVYDDYCKNPPGMSVHGRSTWTPGKALDIFLRTHCGLKPTEIAERVMHICEAMVEESCKVVQASRGHKSFAQAGPRMLHAWNEGMNSLRLQKKWSLPSLASTIETAGFQDVTPPKAPKKQEFDRSPLEALR